MLYLYMDLYLLKDILQIYYQSEVWTHPLIELNERCVQTFDWYCVC